MRSLQWSTFYLSSAYLPHYESIKHCALLCGKAQGWFLSPTCHPWVSCVHKPFIHHLSVLSPCLSLHVQGRRKKDRVEMLQHFHRQFYVTSFVLIFTALHRYYWSIWITVWDTIIRISQAWCTCCTLSKCYMCIIALVLCSSRPLAANWHNLVVSESGGNERHASTIKKMGEVRL